MRQLYLAAVDLHVHGPSIAAELRRGHSSAPHELQQQIGRDWLPVPPLESDLMLCKFSHLFAGGYAAGCVLFILFVCLFCCLLDCGLLL